VSEDAPRLSAVAFGDIGVEEEKWRPKRVLGLFARRSASQAQTSGATFRARFVPSHPGLKPWAILLDHFMVKNQLPCFLNTANLLIRELANQLGSLVSSLNAAAMILSSVHSPRPNWVTNFPADITAIRSHSIRSSFRSEEITTMAFPRSASSLRR
jgi:hypothetical protein